MIIKRLVIWSVIGTGITTVTTQLLTVREFLTQFHGNEITISLVLFGWLLLTGLGSFAAKVVKSSSLAIYSLLIFIIAIWPLIQMIGIRGLRDIMFTHGISPGFSSILVYIFMSISPYCILTGFILPHSLNVLRKNGFVFETGPLYLTDNIGDITGGFLFSFILVYWFKTFATIAITSVFLIITALLLFFFLKRYLVFFSVIIATGIFLFYALDDELEIRTLNSQYGHIIEYKESAYGRVIVTREGGQKTVWESGLPLYSDENIVTSEELIHYPMCQLEEVENVLLVSGGLGETLDEMSKYHPGSVDYVELDPVLTQEGVRLGIITERPFIEVLNKDGREHIRTTRKKYDAIIIALPDPDTFQLNRFFTSEFFSLAKRVLREKGVLSMGFDYSQNYLGETRKKKFSTVFITARQYFKNVLIIPGEKAYFLCSDGELKRDIPRRLESKGIATTYIGPFFSGNISSEKISAINEAIHRDESVNTDFNPRLMGIVFQEWFEKYGGFSKYYLLILPVLMLGSLILMRREQYVVFSTGVASMGAEMLVIFSFQIIYGYIYREIGAIVTVFLLGLLPGAAMGNKRVGGESRQLVITELLLLLMLLVFFLWVQWHERITHRLFFLSYCFIFSFISGYQFPVAARMIGEKKNPAAVLFSSDLLGASMGTIITGALMIPLFGVSTAVVFLAAVKISSLLIVAVRKGSGKG